MPRADDTATSLTGVHGQSAQRIPSFTLISGRRVAAYVTKPNEDDVDGTNPLHAIWSKHATSDDVRIARWEPTAQRMQPGKSKHKFFVAAAHCKTVGELRQVWESQGRPWRLWKFLFASRWILFTIDTAAARLDYARLKAAIEGLPAPPAPVPISEPAVEMIVSEDEAEDESDDDAPLPAGEGDEDDEDEPLPPPVDEENVAEAPPPLEDEPADDDAMEDAEAPAPLFRADERVWATDGATQYPATVLVNCKAGAETVRISWLTGRTGQYDWPLSAVMRELPPRRPRREEAPAAPRRAKAPPAPRPQPAPRPPRVTTFRVGDKVEARYLGDLGGWCAGTVAAINADGSFVIDFDDGDKDPSVRPCHVQAPRPPPAPIITNKRPPPRQRTEPAEKRARPPGRHDGVDRGRAGGPGEGARAHEARGVLLQVRVRGRVALREEADAFLDQFAAADRRFRRRQVHVLEVRLQLWRRLPPPRAAGSRSRGPSARPRGVPGRARAFLRANAYNRRPRALLVCE